MKSSGIGAASASHQVLQDAPGARAIGAKDLRDVALVLRESKRPADPVLLELVEGAAVAIEERDAELARLRAGQKSAGLADLVARLGRLETVLGEVAAAVVPAPASGPAATRWRPEDGPASLSLADRVRAIIAWKPETPAAAEKAFRELLARDPLRLRWAVANALLMRARRESIHNPTGLLKWASSFREEQAREELEEGALLPLDEVDAMIAAEARGRASPAAASLFAASSSRWTAATEPSTHAALVEFVGQEDLGDFLAEDVDHVGRAISHVILMRSRGKRVGSARKLARWAIRMQREGKGSELEEGSTSNVLEARELAREETEERLSSRETRPRDATPAVRATAAPGLLEGSRTARSRSRALELLREQLSAEQLQDLDDRAAASVSESRPRWREIAIANAWNELVEREHGELLGKLERGEPCA